MPSVVIIYFSQTGTTHKLAEALQSGVQAEASGVSCNLYRIGGDAISNGRFVDDRCLDLVDDADAILFGSPTYMGGPAAQFKAFADASSERWETQRWSNKIAGGFTTGTSPGGDQLSTLQYFGILAAQHGMLWLGLVKPQSNELNLQGTQLGLSVCAIDDVLKTTDIKTAEYYGRRFAGYVTSRL